MKRTLLSALVVVLFAPYAKAQYFGSSKKLVADCERAVLDQAKSPDLGYCMGYVSGLRDAITTDRALRKNPDVPPAGPSDLRRMHPF